MRIPAVLLLVVALSGCADSHQWLPGQSGFNHPIRQTDKVYIATPADGEYGDQVYKGSGRNTAQILYAAFSRRSAVVTVDAEASSYELSLEKAKRSRQDILILASILHWEDRATEWSMIPDKVEVKISVIEVSSGAVISSGIATGKSGIATFGGDHPQDLLPEPIEAFVSSLY
ncbi:DUF4823 domain-containing protein [Pseudomonas sp. Bout1]|uniref:DUF4823 domain-containing protein n=1 Tax=Pseudomonas sp. Bout1 TaxID=3048600 RepID=UPI002AB55F80|nr:DUF4823 domain-containing protein [Pseudomonas sp. Bout1]MDY7532997.1 DUF4823 domain-containing protein [Pseudomonas sp. Bout1]MEB0185930.1 DUF4823 domain-containing protein [Pseudomonas sp. Bout1]